MYTFVDFVTKVPVSFGLNSVPYNQDVCDMSMAVFISRMY